MTTQPGPTSASMDVPHSQNTAPVLEFRCLYTADIRRKQQKRWQDGRLRFHTFNKRVMVYDEKSNFVGDTHWKGSHFEEGEELELERGGILVEVGECIGKRDQDLTELVDKRIKDREERVAAKVAASPSATMYRGQSTPTESALLRPKPLNAMLTPTGHYGRAVMPNTSPFEERQATKRDESEPPAKKRRQNDMTSSKNGYAQNLMGAPLSLGSAKPSSTPTIRYEPFKARSVHSSCSEAIDLTLDEEEERRASDLRRKVAQEQKAAIERPSPRQKKTKRSPPAKSGYASNLTGTPLMLSSSVVRPPAKVTTSRASIQQHDHEGGDSDSEDDEWKASDIQRNIAQEQRAAIERSPPRQKKSRRPPPAKSGYASNLTGTPLMLSGSGVVLSTKSVLPKAPVQQYDLSNGSSNSESESSMRVESVPRPGAQLSRKTAVPQPRKDNFEHFSEAADSSENAMPSSKVANIVQEVRASSPQARNLFEEDSPAEEDIIIDDEPLPRSIVTIPSEKSKEKLSNKRRSEQESSIIDLDPSPKKLSRVKKRQKEMPATKATRPSKATPNAQSRSSSLQDVETGTLDLHHAGSFSTSAIQESSAIEPTPDRPRSALRIKSRPARQMLMLMSRPSSRPTASNTSFDSSRPNVRTESKTADAPKEVELSQATIQLNAFCENQQAELEARLRRIESKTVVRHVEEEDEDEGLDHQMIDVLLTQKTLPGKLQEKPIRSVSSKRSLVQGRQSREIAAETIAGKPSSTSSEPCNPDQMHGSSQSNQVLISSAATEMQEQHNRHTEPPIPAPSVNRLSNQKNHISEPAMSSQAKDKNDPAAQPRREATVRASESSERSMKIGNEEAVLTRESLPLERSNSVKSPPTEPQRLPAKSCEIENLTISEEPLNVELCTSDAVLSKEPFPRSIVMEKLPPTQFKPNSINTSSSPPIKEPNQTTPAAPAAPIIHHSPKSKNPLPHSPDLTKTPCSSMQSSTARFLAMISPSPAKNVPSIFGSPQQKVPLVESIFGPSRSSEDEQKHLITNERQPNVHEDLAEKPIAITKSFSAVEGTLHDKSGPDAGQGVGFSSAGGGAGVARSLGMSLSTSDLAAADSFVKPRVRMGMGMGMGIGAPRARLANPATRGKPLHTVAASTVESLSTMSTSTSMPPPPLVAKTAGLLRIERERELEGEKERNEPLPAVPLDGPWSREAWDLFGWHGPGVST
ncbi:uncharacterized protein RCO7_07076 [Rhynchosporium graminicola]|uniref:5'-3' DNA helicase ZGRF1-like N-terminal domain-containing protein n=1 Tax=Rhynchosporium graminicola TaxID=2792576 RepID=A0A1E1K012_9HELO|nr:uncharacterized protein RCO7_07076 [Rhynchosporium commune]